MSWLTETLFPRRTELEVRVQHYVDKAEASEGRERAAVGNEKRLILELEERDRRLEKHAETITALRARIDVFESMPITVTALREELVKQKRVNDRLSSQLLDATGHNGQLLTPEQRLALGIPVGGAR